MWNRIGEIAGFFGAVGVFGFIFFGLIGVREVAFPCIIAALVSCAVTLISVVMSGEPILSDEEDLDGEYEPEEYCREEDLLWDENEEEEWEDRYVD